MTDWYTTYGELTAKNSPPHKLQYSIERSAGGSVDGDVFLALDMGEEAGYRAIMVHLSQEDIEKLALSLLYVAKMVRENPPR